MDLPHLTLEQIRPWSELKLEALQGYVRAYSSIMEKRTFYCIYVDAFCGAGIHLSKDKHELVAGSPLRVLELDHPFEELHFIDTDGRKIRLLRELVRPARGMKIQFWTDDSARVLAEKILPTIGWDRYMRCLCFLDPYSYNYPWSLMELCGRNRAVEVLLHFPMMALNRDVLRRDPESIHPNARRRMRTFWGNDSWQQIVYSPTPLFPAIIEKDADNIDVVNAYRERLGRVAGFDHVSNPLPFRNRKGNVIYYLILASHNETAVRIMNDMIRAREMARGGEAWRGQRSSGRT